MRKEEPEVSSIVTSGQERKKLLRLKKWVRGEWFWGITAQKIGGGGQSSEQFSFKRPRLRGSLTMLKEEERVQGGIQ